MHRPFHRVVLFIVCSIMINNMRTPLRRIKPSSFIVESYRIGNWYTNYQAYPQPPISIRRRPNHPHHRSSSSTAITLKSWNVRMYLNARDNHHLTTSSLLHSSSPAFTLKTGRRRVATTYNNDSPIKASNVSTIIQDDDDVPDVKDVEVTDIMDLDDLHDNSEDSTMYNAAVTTATTATTTTNTTTNGTNTTTPPMLSWDKFEYSKFPKADARFGGHSHNHTTPNNDNTTDDEIPKEVALERLHDQETILDQQYSQTVSTQHQLWSSIPTNTVRIATDFLQSYLQPERIQRIQSVLQQRTRNVRFLFENPSNPSNVYACLRTVDAFGIQNVDIITQSNQYRGRAAIHQKRNMRTAMGSAKWLTITNYISTHEAIRAIREQHHCRIYASDLNPNAVDIRTIDWIQNPHPSDDQDSNDAPICIVMGNEDSGISDTMRQLVDVTFTLPMVGFAESFNLSVATAIVLAHLSALSLPPPLETNDDESLTKRTWLGPIRPGDLSPDEYDRLYLKALINSLPQKRMARGMLKTVNVTLPKALNL